MSAETMAAELLIEAKAAVEEEEIKMLMLVEGNHSFANYVGIWEKVGALNVVEEAIESASVVIAQKVLVPQEVEEVERDLMDLADQTAQIEEVTAREGLTAPEESTPTEAHLQEAKAAEEEVQARTADVEAQAEALEM